MALWINPFEYLVFIEGKQFLRELTFTYREESSLDLITLACNLSKGADHVHFQMIAVEVRVTEHLGEKLASKDQLSKV